MGGSKDCSYNRFTLSLAVRCRERLSSGLPDKSSITSSRSTRTHQAHRRYSALQASAPSKLAWSTGSFSWPPSIRPALRRKRPLLIWSTMAGSRWVLTRAQASPNSVLSIHRWIKSVRSGKTLCVPFCRCFATAVASTKGSASSLRCATLCRNLCSNQTRRCGSLVRNSIRLRWLASVAWAPSVFNSSAPKQPMPGCTHTPSHWISSPST